MYVSKANSTNSLAAALFRDGKLGIGEVIYTYCQTEGRGQRGNSWASEPKKNLLMSLIVAPKMLLAEEQFILSQIAALCIRNVLIKYLTQVEIKWPNDIYVGKKKIAGILIENTLTGPYIKHCIVGIGLNINQEEFDETLPNAISLKQLTGKTYNKRSILKKILSELETQMQLINQKDVIYKRYTESLLGYNQTRAYQLPDGTVFEAALVAVQPDGGVILEEVTKHKQIYYFKEVRFIL